MDEMDFGSWLFYTIIVLVVFFAAGGGFLDIDDWINKKRKKS